jgi:hypothetical protein
MSLRWYGSLQTSSSVEQYELNDDAEPFAHHSAFIAELRNVEQVGIDRQRV